MFFNFHIQNIVYHNISIAKLIYLFESSIFSTIFTYLDNYSFKIIITRSISSLYNYIVIIILQKWKHSLFSNLRFQINTEFAHTKNRNSYSFLYFHSQCKDLDDISQISSAPAPIHIHRFVCHPYIKYTSLFPFS